MRRRNAGRLPRRIITDTGRRIPASMSKASNPVSNAAASFVGVSENTMMSPAGDYAFVADVLNACCRRRKPESNEGEELREALEKKKEELALLQAQVDGLENADPEAKENKDDASETSSRRRRRVKKSDKSDAK